MFDNLSTGELLRLAALVTRDISAIWTLATATVALLSVSANRPQMRIIAGGALVWLVALGGSLSPGDKSPLFDRGAIYFILALALVLWTIVFTHLLMAVAERRLQR